MKKKIITAATLLTTATLFAAPIAIKTAKPELLAESVGASIVGRVEGSHTVQLSARVVGELWVRNGEEGSKVKKGDVLYKIEDTVYRANLDTAKAEMAELQAKLTQAEIDAQRYTASETKGGVSKADRDRAVLSRDVAKARVEAARAKVALCENDLSYCTITSPIDGVLGRYTGDVGNNVGPDTGTLRDVICTDPIDVTVAIPESTLRWAFERQAVRKSTRVRILRADGKEVPLDMKVYAFDNKVDAATGTVMVRFRGANTNCELMPGGYVKMQLSAIFNEPKVTVPMSAVVFEGEKRFVYVVEGAKAKKRPVTMGLIQGDRVIIDAGLKAEETIVAGGVHKLFDGAEVKER